MGICWGTTAESNASIERFKSSVPSSIYQIGKLIHQTEYPFNEKPAIFSATATIYDNVQRSSESATTVQRPVAIKAMQCPWSNPHELVPLFLREILFGKLMHNSIASRLRGNELLSARAFDACFPRAAGPPPTIPVLDAFIVADPGNPETHFFLAMVIPWADLGDLNRLSDSLASRPTEMHAHNEELARAMLQPVLEALEEMHGAHCVHRDVKTDNIFLYSSDDQNASSRPQQPEHGDASQQPPSALLADFGLSRSVWTNTASSVGVEPAEFWTATLDEPREHHSASSNSNNGNNDAGGGGGAAAAAAALVSPPAGETSGHDQDQNQQERQYYKRQNSDSAAVCHGECCPLTDVIASRWYRAPELLLGTAYYTSAIDVWSFGCCLYEIYANGSELFRCARSHPDDREAHVEQFETVMRRLAVVPSAPLVEVLVASYRDSPTPRMVGVIDKFRSSSCASSASGVLEAGVDDYVEYDWARIGVTEDGMPSPPSPELAHVLNACLQLNPARRLTATQLLQLPFFSTATAAAAGGGARSAAGQRPGVAGFAGVGTNLSIIDREVLRLLQSGGVTRTEAAMMREPSDDEAEIADGMLTPEARRQQMEMAQKIFSLLCGCRAGDVALDVIRDRRILREVISIS